MAIPFILIMVFGSIFNSEQLDPDKKFPKFFKNNFKEIKSGTIILDNKEYSVQSFYMFKKEISNLDFKEYLAATDQKDPRYYKLPSKELEIFKSYISHPAYDDYPAVFLSKEDATMYCEWLETVLAKNLDLDPNHIEVRLPTKIEWTYSALSGNGENIYAWDGPYLRNSEGKYLANFNSAVSESRISFDEDMNEYKVVVPDDDPSNMRYSPVGSYLPNSFGLYNMSGNVSEMVLDSNVAMGGSFRSPGYDIRARSESKFVKANEFVGFRPIVIIKKT